MVVEIFHLAMKRGVVELHLVLETAECAGPGLRAQENSLSEVQLLTIEDLRRGWRAARQGTAGEASDRGAGTPISTRSDPLWFRKWCEALSFRGRIWKNSVPAHKHDFES